MQSSFSKRPSISTVVQEQRKYSAQQISKIQQSNHKLDQLEQKMKSLLQKDKNRSNLNFYAAREFVNQEPDSDQVNRYFESSKKYNHNYDFANDVDNDDLLLDNHFIKEEEKSKKNIKHFSIYEGNSGNRHSVNTNVNNNNNNKQVHKQKNPKRQKSTGSLKLFKRNDNKNQPNKYSVINGQDNRQNSNFNSKNSKSISFGNHDSRKIEDSKQIRKFSSLGIDKNQKQHDFQYIISSNIANMIHPNTDIHEINQLDLMMQKSLQIKEKQLLLAQQELKTTQQAKIYEYRKNMELQIHLQNMKKYRTQINLMGKGSNPIKLPHTDPQMQILCQEVIKEKTELQKINQNLLNQLKQLQDEEYKLKLQKKRATYELGSQEREFQNILKHHTKRMKQNIPHNHQKSLNNQESTQRLLPKRNPSAKIFKTHKKHSSSTIQPRQSTQYKYQQYLQPHSIKTKRSSKPLMSKSKQKDHGVQRNDGLNNKQKISKSISCSGMNHKNRHALLSCQAQYKNCGTDKVLIEMVHELDKLKDIVNKEIVKTRSKKVQRRVIELIR